MFYIITTRIGILKLLVFVGVRIAILYIGTEYSENFRECVLEVLTRKINDVVLKRFRKIIMIKGILNSNK